MLIEEEEATEEHDVNIPKPSSSSTNKDASDGFETASDSELGPNESDNETQQHLQVQEEQQNLSESDDLALKQVFVFTMLYIFFADFICKTVVAVDVIDNPFVLYESMARSYLKSSVLLFNLKEVVVE